MWRAGSTGPSTPPAPRCTWSFTASCADIPASDLRRFHVDTALSPTPATLAALMAFGVADRVLFGTNWPAAPDVVAECFTRQLDEFTGTDPLLAAAIDRGNAERLFARRLP